MKILKPYLPLFLALVIVGLSAEVHGQPSVSLGVKAGASFSGFRGDDAGDIDFRKGLAGGLFVNISPLKALSIQPELLFQQKGAVNENEDFNFREDVEIGYLNVPVLLKLRLPIGKFYPHVYAGPQFSYAFKSTYSVSALDLGDIEREVDLRNYDVGGVFGFGLDVELLDHLFLTGDVRYGLGGIRLDDNDDVDLKNKDISVMVGAGFRF